MAQPRQSADADLMLMDGAALFTENATAPDANPLGNIARWLQTVDAGDAKLLAHTREYREFMAAAQRMETAHRQISAWNSDHMMVMGGADNSFDMAGSILSFLQHMANDDIVLRVFNCLECRDLVNAMQTCSRFCALAKVNATERTRTVTSGRQLVSTMQLLRAKEQIQGIGIGIADRHVPIPALLLSRRVLVSGAGDEEYNGVYFCTGQNGNGYVFTKPRSPEQRVRRIVPVQAQAPPLPPQQLQQNGSTVSNNSGRDTDGHEPGQLLRCVIAKRFSNETILWYLSKEVMATEADAQAAHNPGDDVRQTFSFWAKLMVIGDAAPNICRYPSQTSILQRHDESGGWQNLSTTRAIQPPVVELLD